MPRRGLRCGQAGRRLIYPPAYRTPSQMIASISRSRSRRYPKMLLSRWLGWILVVAAIAPAAAQTTPFPPGQIVVGPIGNTSGPALPSITTGADANIYTGSVQGGFIPSAPASVVKTSVPTQFVRFFNSFNTDTLGPAVGPWIATASSVRGMTAAQVKNILALPDYPTSVAIVTVPAGTCILGGPGNPALGTFPAAPPAVPTPGPWGAAGAPQYYIVGQNAGAGCATPQNIAASNYIVMLNMGNFALAYGPNAGGGNSGSVAAALDQAIFPAPFTAMDSVYNSLDLLNFTDPAQLRWALSQLSGEVNADLTSVSIESGRSFLGIVGQRLNARSSGPVLRAGASSALDDQKRLQAWLVSAAGGVAVSGNGNTHTLNLSIPAVAGGLEYAFSPAFRAGAAVGVAPTMFSTSGISGNGTATSYYAGMYAGYTGGPFYIDAIAGYGLSSFSTSRQVFFPGQFGAMAGQTASQSFLSAVEAGYTISLAANFGVTPFAGFQSISLWQNGFSESGLSALNLNVAPASLTSFRTLAGIELSHSFAASEFLGLRTRLRVAWAHELAGKERPVWASFQLLPSTTFQVVGATPAANAAVVGLELASTGPIQFFLRGGGEFSQTQLGYSATAGLSIAF